MLRQFISLSCAACLFGVSAAQAEPYARVRFAYDPGGLQQCPEADSVRDSLRRQFGYDPVDPAARDTLTITLSTRDDRIVARATLDRTGAKPWALEREASLSECRSLLDTVVLSARVELDPPIKAGHESIEIAPTPTPPSRDQLTAPKASPRSWTIGLLGGAVLWDPETIAPTIGIPTGIRWRYFSANIEPRVAVPIPDNAFSVGVGSVALLPCLHWRILYGCANASLGVAWLDTAPEIRFVPYVAAGGRVGVQVPIVGRFDALLAADLATSIPMVSTVNEEARRFPSPLFGGASLGVVAHL